MSVPCKFERSLLNHEEYETIRLTHHPDIYDVEAAELADLRSRLRKMHDKERTLSRQKRREGSGPEVLSMRHFRRRFQCGCRSLVACNGRTATTKLVR